MTSPRKRFDCASAKTLEANCVPLARYVSTVTPGYLASKILTISLFAISEVYHKNLPSFLAPS